MSPSHLLRPERRHSPGASLRVVIAAVAAAVAPLSLARPASAQSQTCTKQQAFHQMDFWSGSWEVENAQGKKSADATVTPILKDCALYEDWKGFNGGEDGRGIATYDPLIDQWRYFWVADYGYVSTWTGKSMADRMLFTRTQPTANGGTEVRRWSLIRLNDGRIRELSRASADGGSTWKTEYELFWKRKDAP